MAKAEQSNVCRTRLSKHSTARISAAAHSLPSTQSKAQRAAQTGLGQEAVNGAQTLRAAVHAPAGSAFVSDKPTGPAVLKAPLEPNQQPNYTPSGTTNGTGPEATRKQAEAARRSSWNPRPEAARKPLANPPHACFRSACMRQSLLPSSSYEASRRADQVHRPPTRLRFQLLRHTSSVHEKHHHRVCRRVL